MMMMQPSLTKMKTVTACEQALRKLRKFRKRNETREEGAGKESESSSFPPPLIRAFACHSRWRGCCQSITFLGNRARSVLGEPVYVVRSDSVLFIIFLGYVLREATDGREENFDLHSKQDKIAVLKPKKSLT